MKRTGGQTTEINGEKWWLVLTEVEQLTNGWKHSCGKIIQGMTCYYPIHDSPIPLAGSGDVHSEIVPYCPQCEEEPRGHII